MNEQQRMQYLEAMGVDMFTPRWVLPGARASQLCQLPVANVAPATEVAPVPQQNHQSVQPRPDAQARPEKSAGAVVSHLLDTVARQAKSPLPGPKSEAASPIPVQDEAAFSLAFWRVHSHIMVVDSRQPKALPTQALLQSLLAAMGVTGRLPRAEVQAWPVPGSSDKSWHSAREMIQAFLETRLLSEPVKYLVLMGQDAARAVLAEPDDGLDSNSAANAQRPLGRVNLDSFACEALVTPSLAELLLQPRLKAGLWRLLAPLRLCVNE